MDERKEANMFEKFNERVKKLNVVDIKLIKWAAFLIAIIVVKLFPKLLEINYWILIILVIACSARPAYKFWIKK